MFVSINKRDIRYCADHVAELLEKMPTAQDLEKVFAKLDDVTGKISTGGCTAIVAVVKNGQLCVANAGDARAVLIRKVCFCFFFMGFSPEVSSLSGQSDSNFCRSQDDTCE